MFRKKSIDGVVAWEVLHEARQEVSLIASFLSLSIVCLDEGGSGRSCPFLFLGGIYSRRSKERLWMVGISRRK